MFTNLINFTNRVSCFLTCMFPGLGNKQPLMRYSRLFGRKFPPFIGFLFVLIYS